MLPAQENGNPEIERMWAAHRVERLMAAERAAGSASTNKDEIVRLCEGYSITSEYASFIVLENDAEYQRWSIHRRNATRVSRDRNAQLALRRELDRMRDAAVANMGPEKLEGQRSAEQAGVEPTRFSTSVSNPTVAPSAPTIPTPTLPVESPRSRNIAIPSVTSGEGGGGGAIDPISAAIALGLAGASLAAGRYGRRKQ
jgi:hypothetical protein